MSTTFTTDDPRKILDAFPSATAKRNPRAIIHDIAIWAFLLDVIIGAVVACYIGKGYDASIECIIAFAALVILLSTSSAPLQYRVTVPPAEPAPVVAPAMSALVGEPVYFAEDVDNDQVRSFAEPTSYPIPDSIAKALGSKAAAQITKDTEAHR